MRDTPPGAAPRSRRARAWVLGGVALVAVGLFVIVIDRVAGVAADDGVEDFTAWQSRVEMERVMTETAAAIGLTIEANDPDNLPLSCDLAAGDEGSSLLVTGFEGPALVDIDASLTHVRALWEGRGLVVNDRAINDKKGLSTTLPDGGSFFMLAGPASTSFAGESGCARTVGSSAEAATSATSIAAASEQARALSSTTVVQAADLFETLYSDMDITLDVDRGNDERWNDCSGDPRADTDPPKAIQWSAHRVFYIDPHRETASLLDAVIQPFVADGWEAGTEWNGSGARSVSLTRDGYTLTVGGDVSSSPERVSTLRIGVSSPCLVAPANVLAWAPTPGPTPGPTPSE